jgi:hypothetical protein
MAAPLHATLDEARQAPIPAGFRSAMLMRHGSMALRYDARSGSDPQTPRGQDEIASGACAAHRFESFSADFGTWAAFCGPKGGDHG